MIHLHVNNSMQTEMQTQRSQTSTVLNKLLFK